MSPFARNVRAVVAGRDQERLRLARELADFRTTADQAELETMLERLSAEQAQQVRDTLALVA